MLPQEGITVSELVSVLNQTLEYAYPKVAVIGELANFRVSKNKWLYFDLKDDYSSLKFFGNIYQLRQPLEEGMMLKVSCTPRLHQMYGFSMQVQSIELVGEGTLKRAAELVQAKLANEGLFDETRKRSLPYPPSKIGLITSSQSAAYADFIKIVNSRWCGINIDLVDVQVQGEPAVEQIIDAIKYLNKYKNELEVLVLIRGGGSPDDLAAFSTEALTRAVAASRIPTLVAIGHEIDISLAELASDKRASTPSNAAELLVPDRRDILNHLKITVKALDHLKTESLSHSKKYLELKSAQLYGLVSDSIKHQRHQLMGTKALLAAYDPRAVLDRGYSVVRLNGSVLRSSNNIELGDILDVDLARGKLQARVSKLTKDLEDKENGK